MDQPQAHMESLHSHQAAPLPRQLVAITILSVAAILVNILLYFVLKNIFGVDFIAPEQFPPPEVSPLPVTDVMIFSSIFSLGASLVFLLVAHTVTKPALVFAVISLVVLIASFDMPLRISTPRDVAWEIA